MIAISEDGERASLDRAKLQYVGPPAGRAGLWPHCDYLIEIRIDGDEQSTYTPFVQLAEIVLPKLEAVESASIRHLRHTS